MNNIELIQKYAKDAIAKIFASKAATAVLEADPKYINLDFKEAGYVKLFTFKMDGLADYKRMNGDGAAAGYTNFVAGDATGTGYKRGNLEGSWELFQLTQDRGIQFVIDAGDDEEVAGLIMGNLTKEFARTKVVGEVDAYRLSKLASFTSLGLGNRVSEAIAANTIIGKFNTAYEWLSEVEVESDNQVIFVSPVTMGLIRNTTELQRKLTQAEYKSMTEGVTFTIEKYEGRPIIEVPSSRFYTDIVIDPLNGFHPAATSKLINFLVVKKDIAMPVVKVEKFKVFIPDDVQDGDGYKVNFRLRHDIFVPEANKAGVYASVGTANATTKANLLKIDMVEGSVSDAYQIKAYLTIPQGLSGTLYTAATTFTLGSTTLPAGNKVVALNTDVVEAVATKAFYGLVDGNGKVIAVTGEITLVKKA